MTNHITISLILGDRLVDIRIPTKIEVRKLIRELDTIFQLGHQRKKYQLHVLTKGLVLDEGKTLRDYPIVTGDIIKLEDVT